MRNISYRVSYEKIISRLSAMFAYIEFDKYGVNKLHKATDNYNGCYAKIVENVVVPYAITANGATLFASGETVSYRTLMNEYYAKLVTMSDTDTLKKFVENAIGKRYVTGVNLKSCDLCPEYIYLADVNNLYDEYETLKKKCAFHKTLVQQGQDDTELCCLCKKYERMGGDAMLNFVEGLLSEADAVAEEYLGYAENASPKVSLNFSVNLLSSSNDLGIVTPYIGEWVAGQTYCVGDRVYYEESYDTVGKVYVCVAKTSGKWNEETEKLEFDYDSFKEQSDVVTLDNGDIELSGTSDSKLCTLRRDKEYLNEFETRETPEIGTDWLWYYRVGHVVNVDTLNDDLGNIVQYDTGEASSNGNRLSAYGDVLTSAEVDANERTITFEYIIGCHLKATYKGKTEDDDGNVRYKFSDFKADTSDIYNGVRYVETVYYEEGGELDELAQSGNFGDYVNGDLDQDGVPTLEKYEFITSSGLLQNETTVNSDTVTVSTVTADFKVTVKADRDLQDTLLYREDYYNGISYAPTKDVDVYINRGVTAVNEKLIKFSEVHTLEDMENYQNGGFFNLQES